MTIKDCPIGKILNTLTNRCVNIDGKIGKEIIKNLKLKPIKTEVKYLECKKKLYEKETKIDKKFKSMIVKDPFNSIYLIVNKSIVDDLDKNDVILDPAGLAFMQNSFMGAGWASNAIYELLSTTKPNKDVIKYFSQFKNEKYLYEKNKNNLSIAYYSSYNNIKIIHAVGPNFNNSSYLKKIIMKQDLTELYELMYKVYNDIYNTFMTEYKKNSKLQLRILPISTGSFIDFNKNYKIKLFKNLRTIYQQLNTKYKITPFIYFYDKEDYTLFKNMILDQNYN
jgi:hypothetical protein